MALRHRLAGLIFAATMIAASQFLPATAFAHTGHLHSSGASTAIVVPEGARTSGADSLQILTHVVFVSTNGMIFQMSISSGCSNGCCGTGASCCGVAIPLSVQGPPYTSPARIEPIPNLGSHDGIEPDALGKPPKIHV